MKIGIPKNLNNGWAIVQNAREISKIKQTDWKSMLNGLTITELGYILYDEGIPLDMAINEVVGNLKAKGRYTPELERKAKIRLSASYSERQTQDKIKNER